MRGLSLAVFTVALGGIGIALCVGSSGTAVAEPPAASEAEKPADDQLKLVEQELLAKIEQLEQRIQRLEQRIAQTEVRTLRVPLAVTRPQNASPVQPPLHVPEGWTAKEFNGQYYFLVPLKHRE